MRQPQAAHVSATIVRVISYLVDTLENIWGCLDESMFLESVAHYVRASYVHSILALPGHMMGVLRHSCHRHHNHHYIRPSTVITAFIFLMFTSASMAVTSQTQVEGGGHHHHHYQGESGPALELVVTYQKIRLGSSPPSCRSKCMSCSPCKAEKKKENKKQKQKQKQSRKEKRKEETKTKAKAKQKAKEDKKKQT
ncbi:hypothetical protein FF2_013729 [Malus domestica]